MSDNTPQNQSTCRDTPHEPTTLDIQEDVLMEEHNDNLIASHSPQHDAAVDLGSQQDNFPNTIGQQNPLSSYHVSKHATAATSRGETSHTCCARTQQRPST